MRETVSVDRAGNRLLNILESMCRCDDGARAANPGRARGRKCGGGNSRAAAAPARRRLLVRPTSQRESLRAATLLLRAARRRAAAMSTMITFAANNEFFRKRKRNAPPGLFPASQVANGAPQASTAHATRARNDG